MPADAEPSVSVPTPGGARTALTWAPDGRALVFVGRRGSVQQLYVRRLDDGRSAPAAQHRGRAGAGGVARRPVGGLLGGGALKKAPLTGGPAMDVVAGIARCPP